MVGPLLDKAEFVYLRGRVAAAEDLNQEALRLATDLGLPEHLLRSQVLAARIACTAGDRASAIGQLRVPPGRRTGQRRPGGDPLRPLAAGPG
jgi:hypothetical protein